MGDAECRWVVSIRGEAQDSSLDVITLSRVDRPRIRLEIDAPSIRSAGEDQAPLVRQAIQDTVNALQEALDSPSALPGFRP